MLMAMRKKIKNQKGFTLIELLVVISIIGVMAAIGVPKFMDTTATARTAKVQAELGAIDSAIQIHGANNAGTLSKDVTVIKTYMSGSVMPKAQAGKYKIGTADPITLTEAVDYGINNDYQATIKLGETTYTATSLSAETAK